MTPVATAPAPVERLQRPVADRLAAVARIFDDELRSDQPFVGELCQYVRRYRGKMLRPTLLLLSAEAGGAVRDEHVVLAAVVEMVHLATLVHDDVLDEADLRRDAASVNRIHGNETAVLLGDYLISHAYHLCSRLGSTHAARRIAATTNTVCEGEIMQVAQRGNWALEETDYLEIIRRKTSALTAVCCELGAHVAGAAPDAVERLSVYGRDLGIAFQITDDLLDLTGREDEMGKSLGRDADQGKLTLPLIHYLRRAPAEAREQLIQCLNRGEAGRMDRLADLPGLADSIEYAAEVARLHTHTALRSLSKLPPSEARDALQSAAEFVLQRRR